MSAVAVLAVATAPGPVGAAPGRPPARLSFPAEVTLPLGHDAQRVEILTSVPDYVSQPPPVGSRLTLDLAGLAGVATVAPVNPGPGWTCQTIGAVLGCVAGDWLPSGIYLDVAPGALAEEGGSGQMRLTLIVPGLKPAVGAMTVRIVSNVDLADASPRLRLSGVPGDNITWPVRVRNAGQAAVNGVVALLLRPYRVRFHERHGNCEYAVGFYGRVEFAACRFDAAEIPPGATFEVSPVPPMRIAADAAGGSAAPVVRWYTSFDWANERDRWARDNTNGFTQGTGSPLLLVETARPRASSQTEPDIGNNSGSMYLTVNAVTKADSAALPATITGRVGEYITVRLGNHNYGPTSIDWSDPGEPVVFLRVEVPPGVTVTAGSHSCLARPESPDGFVPGAAEYVCGGGYVHPPGETVWWELTFRIDRRVAGAEGRLAIRGFPELPGSARWDPNPANDTAPLKVRVLGTGGDSGGGGAGGGLPITGAGTGTVGGGLLVLGVLLVLAARGRGAGVSPYRREDTSKC